MYGKEIIKAANYSVGAGRMFVCRSYISFRLSSISGMILFSSL